MNMMTMVAPGHRVIIKPKEIQTTTEAGIIIVREDEEREHKINTSSGTVVAIGPTAWMAYDYYKPDGSRNPAWAPWCKVGDEVYYSKYGVKWIEDENGVEYVVGNDQDIVMVIKPGDGSNG